MITPAPSSTQSAARHLLVLLGSLLALGTVPSCGAPANYVVSMAPSLAPVDATRPMVRYKAIRGSACGGDSIMDALWDMKRLVGVDGYVEVVVEYDPEKKCAKATGYPFTYGEQPKPIQVRGREAAPAAVTPAPAAAPRARAGSGSSHHTSSRSGSGSSGGGSAQPTYAPPAAPAGPTQADCEAACGRFGKLAGTSELIQRVVAQRCVERCSTGDTPYFQCVDGASAVDDVKRCNSK